jgi:hypothetical protein
MKNSTLPGSEVASLRRLAMRPLTGLVYSATEHKPSLATHGAQLEAGAATRPTALHALHIRTHWVQPAHNHWYGVHNTHLVSVDATSEGDAFTGHGSLAHDHRHVTVLSCRHLHILEA